MKTSRGNNDEALAALKAKYGNVAIITIHDALCEQGTCHVSADGVPIFKKLDTNHLSLFGSEHYFDLYMRKHPE